MRRDDYSKQLEKRQMIKGTTLVIGADIGCEFNAIGMINKEGRELGRYPKIYNTREGFDYFEKEVEGIKERYELKEVLIGMEPTGHYWRKIAYFAKEKGYEVRFIRTTALRHQRELNESSSAKSDIRDAMTIANITREGKYIDTIIGDGILRQLRTLSHVRERVQRYNTGTKHALKGLLEDYFPELKQVFWSMKAKGLWAILEESPFPEDILRVEPVKIAELIAKASKRRYEAKEKGLRIYQSARDSIGLKQVGQGDRYRLKMYLEDLKRSERQLKEIEVEMKELLKELPYAKYILSIPGIGILSCAVFLGELGEPAYFRNPKQIVKYSGYDPQESDSGQRIGRKIISKKGRWLLRKYLYFMSMRVIHRNPYFKGYYKKKLEKKNRFGQMLGKKEAMCAVAIKLIKVIFALLRDRRIFTIEAPSIVLT